MQERSRGMTKLNDTQVGKISNPGRLTDNHGVTFEITETSIPPMKDELYYSGSIRSPEFFTEKVRELNTYYNNKLDIVYQNSLDFFHDLEDYGKHFNEVRLQVVENENYAKVLYKDIAIFCAEGSKKKEDKIYNELTEESHLTCPSAIIFMLSSNNDSPIFYDFYYKELKKLSEIKCARQRKENNSKVRKLISLRAMELRTNDYFWWEAFKSIIDHEWIPDNVFTIPEYGAVLAGFFFRVAENNWEERKKLPLAELLPIYTLARSLATNYFDYSEIFFENWEKELDQTKTQINRADKLRATKHKRWNQHMIPFIEKLYHTGQLEGLTSITALKKKIFIEMQANSPSDKRESEETIASCLIEIFKITPYSKLPKNWIKNKVLPSGKV